MTDKINEIVQLFVRLSGEVDEEIQRLTNDSTYQNDVPVRKFEEEETTRHGSQLTHHVTTTTKNNATCRTSYKQPEVVTKCTDGNVSAVKSTQRRTLSTESYFHKNDIQNGGFLSLNPVTYHSSRLPDKMSDNEGVLSGPRPIHHHHKVQGTLIQSRNVCPGFGKKQPIYSVMEPKYPVFSPSKQDKRESQRNSESLVSRQIFEFLTTLKEENNKLDSSKSCNFLSNHKNRQLILESPSERKKSHDDSVEVSNTPSNSAKMPISPQNVVVERGELSYREALNSLSYTRATEPFLKSSIRLNLTKTCIVEDQNANYVVSPNLIEEEEPILQDPQEMLNHRRSVPQLSRKDSPHPSHRRYISSLSNSFHQSMKPEVKGKFTETAMIDENSFDGVQEEVRHDDDDKSKTFQKTVHRSLSECLRSTSGNDFRWPTKERSEAQQTQDAWKPVQACRNSSTSNDLHEIHGTVEKQLCVETHPPVSSRFPPMTDRRPLTVSDVISHMAPHLLIHPISGGLSSSEDTWSPPSPYDNVSGGGGNPSQPLTPTSSTCTEYLPPWDDFSIEKLLARVQQPIQTTMMTEMGSDLYLRGLAEMSKRSERDETKRTYQRPDSEEESQQCQRPLIDDKGQTPSNIEAQFNPRSSINDSVTVSLTGLYSSQDRVRDCQHVGATNCDERLRGLQGNDILETQEIKIPRGEGSDMSKIGDVRELESRLDNSSRIQDKGEVVTRGLEVLGGQRCTTTAKTPNRWSLEFKNRDAVHDIPELHGPKKTRGKSTDAEEGRRKSKNKTSKRAAVKSQGTRSVQTLDDFKPTFQNQKTPSILTSTENQRPYPRQLSLPCHLPVPSAPLPLLKSSDDVLDDSAFSLDDHPSLALDFRHPCNMRPPSRRRTSCLAFSSIPPSQLPVCRSGINRSSSAKFVQRNYSPTSDDLASKNLHIMKDEFQTTIQEDEDYFDCGSFLYISSRKSDLPSTGSDLHSIAVRDHEESNKEAERRTTSDPEVEEWWSALSSALQNYEPPEINRILVCYLTCLSERKETFLGSLIQTFISSTKQATNRNPRQVCRNVRQFMSGVSNYLTGVNCEKEISLFLEAIFDESSSSSSSSVDATFEVFLQNIVVRPLNRHIFQLIEEELSRNEDEKLLRLGLERTSHQSTAELQLKSDLVCALETKMDLISDHFRGLVEAESALSKLESLRGLTSVVFPIIINEKTRANLDRDFLKVMKHLLVQFGLSSAEAEVKFIRDLNRSNLLTEVDVFVIRSFGRAVNELKECGMR